MIISDCQLWELRSLTAQIYPATKVYLQAEDLTVHHELSTPNPSSPQQCEEFSSCVAVLVPHADLPAQREGI